MTCPLPALALPLLAALGPQETPLAWDTVEAHLEAADWLSGVALVVRGDEVVVSHAVGLANREAGIPITADTVFAIGSTPIDFTRAAVLLLVEDGLMGLDEPLPAFFEGVPEDKRFITVEHLMSGASGLRDFHDLPTDRDPDHGWIDRAEAVRRILGMELLFPPGRGQAHSHAAWVLLAAVVEVRADMDYAAFTRARLFEPAGMPDTGFFGEPIPAERLAIGYGVRSDGEVNAPPYWGPTSWLVMGSGGMVSTAPDLLAWNRALRAGKVLSEESLARYWSPPGALLDGGDMYGFEIQYTEGPGAQFLLLSNAIDRSNRERFHALGEALYGLVMTEARSPFSLGLELRLEEERVVVERVEPGGAAEAAGLRAGDELISAGGRTLAPEPMAVLRPYLERGGELALELRRGEETLRVVLEPRQRGRR